MDRLIKASVEPLQADAHTLCGQMKPVAVPTARFFGGTHSITTTVEQHNPNETKPCVFTSHKPRNVGVFVTDV